MNRLKALLVFNVVLVITIEMSSAAQFLPFLVHRRSANHLDHHKLLKEINELEYSPSFGRQPPTSHHRASLEPTTRAPITRKRDFNLDEFTLDDLMNLNGQPVGLEALAIAAATEPTAEPPTTTTTTTELPPGDGRDLHAQPRSANACGKTRVAAGASGYLRLSCVEGTSSSTTTKPNPITPASLVELRASLLHQLDNAQFRRMNSNFEMLVDALRSGAIQPLK